MEGATGAGARILPLDGLRGIAILLVVACHLSIGMYPAYQPFLPSLAWLNLGGAGFVGVQLFFLLSGYLITSGLLRERSRTGHTSLRHFYARRARRLLPALALVIVGYLVIQAIWFRDSLPYALGDAFYAATFTANLQWFFSPFSYHGYLGQTWSLAVEEQFYLVWPLLFIASVRRHPRGPAAVAIAGILATMIARQLLGEGWVGMYTGLRWDALLLGCLLAIVPVRLRGRPALVVGVTSVACLAVICLREPDPIPVHFYTVATVACGAVLVLAFDQKWLANPVLRHFGMISYGLYLWHGVFLRYGLWPPLALALSIGAAEVSYYVVERPLLRPGMSRIARGRPPAPPTSSPPTSSPPTAMA